MGGGDARAGGAVAKVPGVGNECAVGVPRGPPVQGHGFPGADGVGAARGRLGRCVRRRRHAGGQGDVVQPARIAAQIGIAVLLVGPFEDVVTRRQREALGLPAKRGPHRAPGDGIFQLAVNVKRQPIPAGFAGDCPVEGHLPGSEIVLQAQEGHLPGGDRPGLQAGLALAHRRGDDLPGGRGFVRGQPPRGPGPARRKTLAVAVGVDKGCRDGFDRIHHQGAGGARARAIRPPAGEGPVRARGGNQLHGGVAVETGGAGGAAVNAGGRAGDGPQPGGLHRQLGAVGFGSEQETVRGAQDDLRQGARGGVGGDEGRDVRRGGPGIVLQVERDRAGDMRRGHGGATQGDRGRVRLCAGGQDRGTGGEEIDAGPVVREIGPGIGLGGGADRDRGRRGGRGAGAGIDGLIARRHHHRHPGRDRVGDRLIERGGIIPAETHIRHRRGLVVGRHPVDTAQHAEIGTGTGAIEHLDRDQVDLLGHAIGVATDDAGDMGAVTVAIRVLIIDLIGAPGGTAGEVDVGGADAGIDDVDVHPRRRVDRGEALIEGQGALVDPIQSPGRLGLGRTDRHPPVLLHQGDARILGQGVRRRRTQAQPHPRQGVGPLRGELALVLDRQTGAQAADFGAQVPDPARGPAERLLLEHHDILVGDGLGRPLDRGGIARRRHQRRGGQRLHRGDPGGFFQDRQGGVINLQRQAGQGGGTVQRAIGAGGQAGQQQVGAVRQVAEPRRTRAGSARGGDGLDLHIHAYPGARLHGELRMQVRQVARRGRGVVPRRGRCAGSAIQGVRLGAQEPGTAGGAQPAAGAAA